jgi:hypothetical protein
MGTNASGLTPPVDPHPRPYYNQPFLVLGAGRFTAACRRSVTDGRLSTLPLIGSVDQLADSTDLLTSTHLTTRLRALYRA